MAHSTKQKLMDVSDIPALVDDIIKAGCDICAIGHDKYIIGDAELQPGAHEKTRRMLDRIERSVW